MKNILEQFNLLNNNEQLYLLDIILEGIKSARELYLDILGQGLFDKLTETDPSKTKKYLNWMCKQYIKRNKVSYGRGINPYNMDIEKLEKLIKNFDYRVNKGLIKNKDINYYKNIDDVEQAIEKSQTKSETEYKEYIKKTEANIILDNDKYFIVEPLTWEASKIYGKGTKWCTSSKLSIDAWNIDVAYIKARIFYIRNKKLNIDNSEYKIAIHVPIYWGKEANINYSNIPCKVYNAEDKATVSNLETVANSFGIDADKIINIKYVDTKIEIKEWLDKMNIENYVINDDLTVDVNGNVNLNNKNLSNIPVLFGRVKGNFRCAGNKLTSLEFVPKECKNFDCIDNILTYKYLNTFNFSFVKNYLCTDYGDIDNKWDKIKIKLNKKWADYADIDNKGIKLNKKWADYVLSLPESGMGYHVVDIILNDNSIIKNIIIFNAEDLELPYKYKAITSNEIKNIILHKK